MTEEQRKKKVENAISGIRFHIDRMTDMFYMPEHKKEDGSRFLDRYQLAICQLREHQGKLNRAAWVLVKDHNKSTAMLIAHNCVVEVIRLLYKQAHELTLKRRKLADPDSKLPLMDNLDRAIAVLTTGEKILIQSLATPFEDAEDTSYQIPGEEPLPIWAWFIVAFVIGAMAGVALEGVLL